MPTPLSHTANSTHMKRGPPRGDECGCCCCCWGAGAPLGAEEEVVPYRRAMCEEEEEEGGGEGRCRRGDPWASRIAGGGALSCGDAGKGDPRGGFESTRCEAWKPW